MNVRVKATAEKPTVLIVSSNQLLLDAFKLKIGVVEEIEFLFLNFKDAPSKIDQSQYYKVLWLVDSKEIISFNQEIVWWLASFTIPLNIAYFIPPRIVFNNQKLNAVDFFLKQEKKFSSLIKKNLNLPQIIKGYEVVDEEFIITPISSLTFFTQRLDEKILIQPNVKTNYLSLAVYYKKLLRVVLRPHQANVLVIKNKKTITPNKFFSTLERVYEVYHKTGLSIRNINLKLLLKSTKDGVVSVDCDFYPKIKILAQNLSLKNLRKIKHFVAYLEGERVSKLKVNRPTKDEDEQKRIDTTRVEVNKKEQVKHDFDLDNVILGKLAKSRKKEKGVYIDSLAKEELKAKKKNTHRKAIFFAGLVMVFVGVTISLLVIIYFLSLKNFKTQFNNRLIKIADTNKLETEVLNQKLFNWQTNTYQNLVKIPYVDSGKNMLEFNNSLNQLELEEKKLSNDGQQLLNLVLKPSINDDNHKTKLTSLVEDVQATANKSNNLIETLISKLENIALEMGLSDAQTETIKVVLKLKRKQLSVITQISPMINEILGVNQPKTYVLVYQDNNELRSTGGVIGAVAVLSFNNGKLTSYEVYSADELDQKIPGVIEPPESLAKYLGEKQWFFVDANWDNQGEKAGERVAWFLEKALGFKPDGVVFIDNQGLKQLISPGETINLPEYNEVLNSKNLDEKVIFYTAANPKKTNEYLAEVLKSVLDASFSQQKDIFQALNAGLESQDIILTQFDKNQQSLFNRFLWSGDVVRPKCPSLFNNQACQVDSLAQIESNIGLNKVNYYLTREIKHTVVLNQKFAQHERKVFYKNLAKTTTWPKGDYKAIVKIFVPPKTTNPAVFLDGKRLPFEFKRGKDQALLEFEIVVPVNSARELLVKFNTPVLTQENLSYLFFDQNQPGSKDDVYTLKIINDLNLKPKLIAPQAEIKENEIIFHQTQDKNLLFAVKF